MLTPSSNSGRVTKPLSTNPKPSSQIDLIIYFREEKENKIEGERDRVIVVVAWGPTNNARVSWPRDLGG